MIDEGTMAEYEEDRQDAPPPDDEWEDWDNEPEYDPEDDDEWDF